MQSAAKVEKLYHDIGDLDMHLLKVFRDKSFLNIDNNDRSYFKKKNKEEKKIQMLALLIVRLVNLLRTIKMLTQLSN